VCLRRVRGSLGVRCWGESCWGESTSAYFDREGGWIGVRCAWVMKVGGLTLCVGGKGVGDVWVMDYVGGG
jgi:hypothetical protein